MRWAQIACDDGRPGVDRAEGTLRAEPGQVAVGLVQDAGHGVGGDAEDVAGTAAEQGRAVGDEVENRAGEVAGDRLRFVLRRRVTLLRLPVLVIRLSQDAAQRRACPVGERRLFEHREASAEQGRQQSLGGEGVFGHGGSRTAVASSSARVASTMKRLVSLPSGLVSQRPSSAVTRRQPDAVRNRAASRRGSVPSSP
jgi:hypothetical protein